MFEHESARLHEIAAECLALARGMGASDAAVEISESSGLAVNVRRGSVETIEQTRDKGVGVTVHLGKRRGHASSSDFSSPASRPSTRTA